jgi:glutamate receptor, ionotropic, invertebrate
MPFFGFAGITILMRKEENSIDIFSFFNVFELPVWILIFLAIFLVGLFVYLLEKHSPFSSINTNESLLRKTQIKYDLRESIWLSLGGFCLAGAENPPHTLSTRMLLYGFYFFSSICISTFQAELAAFLTLDRFETSIDSLRELANQNKIEYSFVSGTSVQAYFEDMRTIEENFYQFWLKSSLFVRNLDFSCDGDTKILSLSGNESRIFRKNEQACNKNFDDDAFELFEYQSLWLYPLSNTYTRLLEKIKKTGYMNNTYDGIKRVLNSKVNSPFALILDYPAAFYATKQYCELTIVGSQFSTRPYAIGVAKGSPLRDMLTDVILQLQRESILDQLKTKWWNSGTAHQCTTNTGADSKITLNLVGGIFIFISIFIFITIILFLVEYLRKN